MARLPTTEEIRGAFAEIDSRYSEHSYAQSVADFDAWLLTIQDAAWQAGSHQGFVDGEATVWDPQHERTRSPYRKEQS